MAELPAEVAYLDNAASTPLCQQAAEAMAPLQRDLYANPTGSHRMARDSRRRIDDARDVMAEVLGCEPGEIIFTAGGTESDNLAIFGRCWHMADLRGAQGVVSEQASVPVCSAIEHHAVLEPVERLGGIMVGVDASGTINLDALASELSANTAIVSVMLANNETGMVQPLAQVAEVVRSAAPNAVLHSDAVQAMAWLDVAAQAGDADLVSVSAHKFGGPKGTGALMVRNSLELSPLLLGGGQERGLRSGTHNVAGIVGMAAAAEVVLQSRAQQVERVSILRDRLVDGLLAKVPHTVETGDRSRKVAGSAHLCFEGVESEALLFLIEDVGVYASAASSCSSGAQDPSHVLAAMGYSRELAGGSLRLSLGYETTQADVDLALSVIPDAVARLRDHASDALAM
ncbi:MAG: cysteine desulfurase [Acidimicrobiia bacterium]|nr:cysteine desulfurase [Acidimicrobiia bacterium]MYC57184.1 cysteine desulfurase [Acidimicrobiia bacterium]MYG93889.1 cysteine desulfurase [Acidimicrobiia bacterium]MYI29892.1 cysteine desulfurase [Acidimicrobiia bacterium]